MIGLSGAFGVMAIIRAEANAPFFRAGFSWSTIIVAVVSAVAVGLVFGTYPALRAARMSPIRIASRTLAMLSRTRWDWS